MRVETNSSEKSCVNAKEKNGTKLRTAAGGWRGGGEAAEEQSILSFLNLGGPGALQTIKCKEIGRRRGRCGGLGERTTTT